MKNKKLINLSKSIFACIVSLLFMICFIYADNVNTLSIEPTVNTGRYFCPINFSVKANGGGFSNCMYVLSGDFQNNKISYVSRGSAFNETDYTGWNGSLFFVEEKNASIINSSAICSTFLLTGESTNKTGTTIKLVNKSGAIPTVLDFTNTTDGLNLSYNGEDTLTGVLNMDVVYELCPCELDGQKPTITGFSHNMNGTVHYNGNQTIKFLVYDKTSYNQRYWTSGKNLNQAMATLPYIYTGRNLPAGMDNQEGVNSGTITVKIYSGSSLIGTPTLTKVVYTGNLNRIPKYTWDGNDRGYRVSFDYNLGVEQPVTVVIEVSDNTLNNGSCVTQTHKNVFTGYLNNREKPQMTLTGPVNGQLNVFPNASVSVFVSDSWAGIDTGTVKITIPEIRSGGQIIMSGYTYSGSDLNFLLVSGSASLGGASAYKVTFQPKYEFPVSTQIMVTGYVQDFVGEFVNMDESFTTRADCSFYGCINYVDIFSGVDVGASLIMGHFTGSLIIVTGTVAPYPYLTGTDLNIVDCGPTEIRLNGNIDIENWSEGDVYPYTGLYVTGLSFRYESGVIIPIY